MKISELKKMSISDLKLELNDSFREQFSLRMQKSTGQLTKFHLINNVRKKIARIKTILCEKKEDGIVDE